MKVREDNTPCSGLILSVIRVQINLSCLIMLCPFKFQWTLLPHGSFHPNLSPSTVDFHCITLNETMCLRVRFSPPYETTNIKYMNPPHSSSPFSSDRMWGVRSFKESECEQNVWNSRWSILDRDLLKSHLLDMFPWRVHFSIGEGREPSLWWRQLFCRHRSINVTDCCFTYFVQVERIGVSK